MMWWEVQSSESGTQLPVCILLQAGKLLYKQNLICLWVNFTVLGEEQKYHHHHHHNSSTTRWSSNINVFNVNATDQWQVKIPRGFSKGGLLQVAVQPSVKQQSYFPLFSL